MTDIERYRIPGAAAVRLGLLAAGLFVVGTNGFVIAGVLPEIAAALHVRQGELGLSVTLYAAIVAVASPVVSILAARAPRAVLMSAGLLLVGVGTLVAAGAGGVGAFFAGRAVAGLGGAALVPAATAAAPALLPAAERGRALALAALGFTLATAIGSPLGTWLASVGGWRLPLAALALIAIVLAAAVAVVVRGLPTAAAGRLADRFRPLADRRVLLVLGAIVLLTASFNVVYLFSSAVVRGATGGEGSVLSLLLLVYGLAGIAGTALAGRSTDRWGSGRTALAAAGIEAAAFLVLCATAGVLAVDVVTFAVWGLTAFAAVVPMQHRLVSIDPGAAAVTLSWYSTALYVGIALAPLLGDAALAHGAAAVPLAGAFAAGAAALCFAFASLRGAGLSVPAPR